MNGKLYAALAVAVVALVTAAVRFAPFLIFRGGHTPPVVNYLSRMLPFAVMGMLVVYCLKGTSFAQTKDWLPALIACAAVALLHWWKKNTLLSILGGTVCYMLLVQLVFA